MLEYSNAGLIELCLYGKGQDFKSIHSSITEYFLQHVGFSPAIVERFLTQFNISPATGTDGISALILRNCASVLSCPFSSLFKRSLLDGQPPPWKIANITPFQNKSSKTDAHNYRPISLLSNQWNPLLQLTSDTISNPTR